MPAFKPYELWERARDVFCTGSLQEWRHAVDRAYAAEVPDGDELEQPCWHLVGEATLEDLQAAGANGRWRLAVGAGEEMLTTGVPVLLGKEWYSSEYWLPEEFFPQGDSSERYYRFGFDVGFTVGMTLLGVPDEPSRAALARADDGAAVMTWVPSEGAPHRYAGREFAARFAGLVCAFVSAVGDEEALAGTEPHLSLTMPLHHGFVTAVALADTSRQP